MARANAAYYVSRGAALAPVFFVHGDAAALLADALAFGDAAAVPATAADSTAAALLRMADAGVFELAAGCGSAGAGGGGPLRCRLVPGAGGGGILLEFSGLIDVAPVMVAATLCFAAPPWGGDEYLTSGAADAASSSTGVEQMSGVAVEADLAAALTAADVAFAAAGASPFDLDCGLRILSEAGVRLATALALPAPAPASPGTVGGAILLAALVHVTARYGLPLQLYLPRNCPRAALVALLAAATAPWLSAPRQRECVRASLGGTAPTTATFEDLFLDDRRDATALLVTLAST
jgi:hypothetical protein